MVNREFSENTKKAIDKMKEKHCHKYAKRAYWRGKESLCYDQRLLSSEETKYFCQE